MNVKGLLRAVAIASSLGVTCLAARANVITQTQTVDVTVHAQTTHEQAFGQVPFESFSQLTASFQRAVNLTSVEMRVDAIAQTGFSVTGSWPPEREFGSMWTGYLYLLGAGDIYPFASAYFSMTDTVVCGAAQSCSVTVTQPVSGGGIGHPNDYDSFVQFPPEVDFGFNLTPNSRCDFDRDPCVYRAFGSFAGTVSLIYNYSVDEPDTLPLVVVSLLGAFILSRRGRVPR